MKKGFTLIELLAVIVILAIIALIATPIVLSIINDTKESAMLRSADFYLDGVELSVSQAILKEINIVDGKYPIMEDGNLCIGTLSNDTCEGKALKVDVKGEKPSGGTITITSGQVTDIELNLNNKVVSKDEKGELFFKEKLTLVKYIKELYNPTTTATVSEIEYDLDTTNLLMNDRLASNDVAKTDGNIRYYGKSPNNYIDIGDRDADGNIIFWRIIGLFKNIEVTDEEGNVIKKEDLVKIIRSDNVGGISWDYTSTGSYRNDWKSAALNNMLNSAYYSSESTNYYNNNKTPSTLDFISIGLSSCTHNKIERVNWSLGSHNNSEVYMDVMYGAERLGINKWSGKIALIYPSDYGYSVDLSCCQQILNNYNDSTCISTNWLYTAGFQWTITTVQNSSTSVFRARSAGDMSASNANDAHKVRPVMYLKSDVSIVEEKETSDGLKYFVVE